MGDFTNFSPRSGTVCVRRHANYPAAIQMIARKPATCLEPEPVSDTGHPCFEVYFHVAWRCTNAVLVAKNAVSLGLKIHVSPVRSRLCPFRRKSQKTAVSS